MSQIITEKDQQEAFSAAFSVNLKTAQTVNNKKLEERLHNIILASGIPPHVLGFRFLRDAVALSCQNPKLINSMTKGLYPLVAEMNETTASKVERGIRHAISVCWERGKIENINQALGLKVYQKDEKPTNSELIALITDRLLLEHNA